MERLFVFFSGVGIPNHSGTDSQKTAALAVDEGADAQVAREIASGQEQAHEPGIDTARSRLQIADDLHGVVLGRSRDRRAGKGSRHDGRHAGFRQQLPYDRAGHLPHGPVGLYREQRRDGHRPRPGDAAQVVADHVHDHQVLRSVLL